jgi:hypothetical protein
VRAGVYARISSDREADGLGVARQIADCERLAERKGWHVAGLYQTGAIGTGNPIIYTTSAADAGHTFTASVTACDTQQNCILANATGSLVVGSGGGGGGNPRNITYGIYIDGSLDGTATIQNPTRSIGGVEAQPRNGICQKFDAEFNNFSLGLAQGSDTRVDQSVGMSQFALNLNGGANASPTNPSNYPGATISPQTATHWRSTMWQNGLSCPNIPPPPNGTGPAYPYIGGIVPQVTTGYTPISLSGTETTWGAGFVGGNNELQLDQYWILGNLSCPAMGTGWYCDWIEFGTIEGNYTPCGAPINNGLIYTYIEVVNNRTTSSLQNQTCLNDGAYESIAHWRDSAGTQNFYVFGPGQQYGWTHTFQLQYISG